MCRVSIKLKIFLTIILSVGLFVSFSLLPGTQSLFYNDSVCQMPSSFMETEYAADAVVLSQGTFRQIFEAGEDLIDSNYNWWFIPDFLCRVYSERTYIRYDVRHEIIIKIIQHFHNSKYKGCLPYLYS